MHQKTKPRFRIFLDNIFNTLHFRKLYHFTGGVLWFIGLLLLPPLWFLILGLCYLALFAWIGHRISYALIGISLLLLLTHSQTLTAATWLTFFVGDGIAPLVGTRYGRHKWPWHPRKTVEGSAAFFLAAGVALLIFLVGFAGAPVGSAVTAVIIISLLAALVESIPIPRFKGFNPGDNLPVILTIGLTLILLSSQLGLNDVP